MVTTKQTGRGSLYVMGGAVLLIAVLVVGLWFWHVQQASAHVIKQTVNKYEQLMSLTPLNSPPTKAKNFTLTDQNGKRISLDSFQGKVVILEFMDPVCQDICPIVSQELVKTNQILGTKSSQIVYLAVNVNQYHESKSAVMKFSKEHGLTKLPNWHFLTGTTAQLKTVWHEYGVEVTPNPTGDVQHSSLMYFIGKKGMEKYLANPTNKASQISQWAKGISSIASALM